ncbi:unnamed protein product [Schistosoma curassoni]|uniref:DNA primase n=1 Tax=Schistosoma curassoni TaxID=6186 RepID=A0A183JYY3_9TREM|nr:unnamed protein product [Schistosoma curassoni]
MKNEQQLDRTRNEVAGWDVLENANANAPSGVTDMPYDDDDGLDDLDDDDLDGDVDDDDDDDEEEEDEEVKQTSA